MNFLFYKIRVLQNAVFLATKENDSSSVDVYCLTDLDLNRAELPAGICLHDLKSSINTLAGIFGVSNSLMVNRQQERFSTPGEWRPVCDTDFNYDPGIHPYIAGFRSTNFDLCLMAAMFSCHLKGTDVTASRLRELASHLDYNRCNIDWYSTADFGLAKSIRQNMIRSGRHFDVARLNEKQSLSSLHKIAGYLGEKYQAESLARIESTMDLQTAIDCLCSDVKLIQTVFESDFYFSAFETKRSALYSYPEAVFEMEDGQLMIHPDRVKKSRCTIDSTYAQLSGSILSSGGRLYDLPWISYSYPGKDFAEYMRLPVRNVLNDCRDFFYKLFPQREVRADFDRIYRFFQDFEGKTADDPALKNSREVLMLYGADGKPRGTYAMFSRGGIHGTSIRFPENCESPSDLYAQVFARTEKGGWKLRPEFQITVSQTAAHCDFKSFYPHLCINTGTFLSPQTRQDRMIDLLQRKSDLENQIRQESDPRKADQLRLQRQAAKLLINSATGAADASYDSPIRMNNRILSLRLIGQLITWKMAQMFAYCGADVLNINTDGIYVSAERPLVDKILRRIENEFRIPIESDNSFLIAKDVNNTLTLSEQGEILSASGASISNWNGINLDKSPDRPAAVDWVLARMLHNSREDLSAPFDRESAMKLLRQLLDKKDWHLWFQWILNIQKGSVYFTDPERTILNKHSRVFLVAESGQNLKRAVLKPITEKQRTKRTQSGQAEHQHDLLAVQILRKAGVNLSAEYGSDAVLSKIPKWEDHWKIQEASAFDPESLADIRSKIDLETYADIVCDVYEGQWKCH